MTTYRIPSSSYNNFHESSLNILTSLKRDDNICNIISGRGSGKSNLVANIISNVIEFVLFERILCISPGNTTNDQFIDILLPMLYDYDIKSHYSRNTTIIKCNKVNIMLTEFNNRFEGYTNDLLIINESDSLTNHNYNDLYPVYLRAKALITTSVKEPDYFRSNT